MPKLQKRKIDDGVLMAFIFLVAMIVGAVAIAIDSPKQMLWHKVDEIEKLKNNNERQISDLTNILNRYKFHRHYYKNEYPYFQHEADQWQD